MAVLRVLVVEDEPLIREMMVEVLKDAGYEVDQATDSAEAVTLLESDGYRLLVTDIHMPGELDGFQIAERAQQYHPALPVVFVTGRPDVMSELTLKGARGVVLPKPFDFGRLVATVQQLTQR